MSRTSNVISNLTAGVGAGASVTIRPAVGEAWLIKDVTSNNAPVTGVSDVEIQLTDGVTPVTIATDPTTDPGKRVNQFELYITRDLYLNVINRGGAGAEIGWIGEKVNPALCVGDIVAIGVGVGVAIQPPTGQTWKITDYGCDVWTAGPADINPDVSIQITDGVLVVSNLIDPTMIRGQDKVREWYIDNDVYLQAFDTGGAGCNFAYTGIRVPDNCISFVTDVAGSGTYDIRPAAGSEWLITEISAQTWVGVAPNGYPDITVSLMVGAELSNLMTGAGAELRWNQKTQMNIDNTHWLRITETSTANNEVGFLGILKRVYDN